MIRHYGKLGVWWKEVRRRYAEIEHKLFGPDVQVEPWTRCGTNVKHGSAA